MVDPRSDTQYTCEILDGGQEPIVSLLVIMPSGNLVPNGRFSTVPS